METRNGMIVAFGVLCLLAGFGARGAVDRLIESEPIQAERVWYECGTSGKTGDVLVLVNHAACCQWPGDPPLAPRVGNFADEDRTQPCVVMMAYRGGGPDG